MQQETQANKVRRCTLFLLLFRYHYCLTFAVDGRTELVGRTAVEEDDEEVVTPAFFSETCGGRIPLVPGGGVGLAAAKGDEEDAAGAGTGEEEVAAGAGVGSEAAATATASSIPSTLAFFTLSLHSYQ